MIKEGLGRVGISGKILVFRGSKGSTVGPYVMYSLCRSGKGPAGMIVEKADQLVIISAVLCNIVTVEIRDLKNFIDKIPGRGFAEIDASRDRAVVRIYV